MAKWISPREQRERETAKLVAQYRPVAQAAVMALTADWTAVPDDHGKQIYKAVRLALTEAGLSTSGDANYAALVTLQEEGNKPFLSRWQQQQRDAKKAAEEAVDTNRPVVAQCNGAYRLGELVILKDSATHTQRVLVVIGGGKRWDDELGHTESYADLAEPNETEKASADYQRMAATVTAENERDAAYQMKLQRQHEAARQDSLADGHKPTLLDDLFAGGNDD